ncbi:hypothetical protein CAEBREN_10107 [Caenorhabditis brenneri]|uniref:Uncharacterized protein n=1 Tax=Caenorhabditis brenneri TaxID=135651 RepID=G0N1P7_CAEBE|nr:hypothetical protein CAEBREN_10107 [Caenorhabditis brenneri]
MYAQLKEQQDISKYNYMRENYNKLPSWSRKEVNDRGLGFQQSDPDAIQSLRDSIQQRFKEDKQKFMKENEHKLPSWSKS